MIPYRARVHGRYVGLKRTKPAPIEAVHAFEEMLGGLYELVPYDSLKHQHGIAHAGEVHVRGALRAASTETVLMVNRSQCRSTAELDRARDRLTPRIPS